MAGRPLLWDGDVVPGDVLLAGDGHFIVLAGDDGDGELGLTDRVAHCWRRPPALTRLGLAIPDGDGDLKLIRRDR